VRNCAVATSATTVRFHIRSAAALPGRHPPRSHSPSGWIRRSHTTTASDASCLPTGYLSCRTPGRSSPTAAIDGSPNCRRIAGEPRHQGSASGDGGARARGDEGARASSGSKSCPWPTCSRGFERSRPDALPLCGRIPLRLLPRMTARWPARVAGSVGTARMGTANSGGSLIGGLGSRLSVPPRVGSSPAQNELFVFFSRHGLTLLSVKRVPGPSGRTVFASHVLCYP
jgi:hypothetical protein